MKRLNEMVGLDEVSKRLKSTLDEFDRERSIQISKLEEKEKQLRDRLSKLDEEKLKTASANGNVNASDDDILEINAGGKVIAVKRATLTQLQGSRLEAMFSGRWDKKLVRDNVGRIFLDVNSDCFQAIVDYMNELAISSADEPPEPPTVDDELQRVLKHQMKLFGLSGDYQIDSNIITQCSDVAILHSWLEEDGCGGELGLLYRSSRDGQSGSAFHSKCDNKGPTFVIIETAEGGVIGGYTNTAWKQSSGWAFANKAFLFALSGFGLSSPCKMKLKKEDDEHAIYNDSSLGPCFGSGVDMQVSDSTLKIYSFDTALTVSTYKRWPSKQLTGSKNYNIKEVEVFQVTPLRDPREKKHITCNAVEKVAAVDMFSKKVNDAINNKWTTLRELEAEVLALEENFKDEEQLIESLGSKDPNNVVMLNVSGTMMATSRAALLLCEDSVLAQQFDDSKWTEQGSVSPRVKDWTPDDVTSWVKSIKDVPGEIATLFWENEIKGSELLALNERGLEMIGVKRAGTICLLLKEIKQLEKASQDTAALIEYSPYCFGKILDYLRLKHLHAFGLVDEPALPTVRESQKKRFEKVVKYYFPGRCSKFILG
eukprot:scaffold647_cov150-Skeletonema_menzelii.AAC.31